MKTLLNKRRLFTGLVLFIFTYQLSNAYSATAVGTVRQYVPGNISIYNVSDMDFGTAAPGAPRLRLPNENLENPQNASFRIQGEARMTFTITLPTGSIFLTSATSSDQIEVRRFRSRPNGSGRIRNSGERMLFVSAQRQPIPTTITPGLYRGSFVVDVVY